MVGVARGVAMRVRGRRKWITKGTVRRKELIGMLEGAGQETHPKIGRGKKVQPINS